MTGQPVCVFLQRNTETAEGVTRILGLPHMNWTEVQISFGTDEVAIVQVNLILTPQQLKDLAELAATSWSSSPLPEGYVPFVDLPEEEQDRLVQEAIDKSFLEE